MGRKPKITVEGNTISGTAEDITSHLKSVADKLSKDAEQKPYEITSASIKEQLCNYGYEIKTGPCAGDKIPTRKGSAEVHQDMNDAFAELNVHLAIIDDAFQYVFDELDSLEVLRIHAVAGRFTVTGFKIQGSLENEGFVLIGEKYVGHGNIGLETPKISASSNYQFYDELKEAIENAREEVEEYMNGKSAPKYEQGELDFDNKETVDAFAEEAV